MYPDMDFRKKWYITESIEDFSWYSENCIRLRIHIFIILKSPISEIAVGSNVIIELAMYHDIEIFLFDSVDDEL